MTRVTSFYTNTSCFPGFSFLRKLCTVLCSTGTLALPNPYEPHLHLPKPWVPPSAHPGVCLPFPSLLFYISPLCSLRPVHLFPSHSSSLQLCLCIPPLCIPPFSPPPLHLSRLQPSPLPLCPFRISAFPHPSPSHLCSRTPPAPRPFSFLLARLSALRALPLAPSTPPHLLLAASLRSCPAPVPRSLRAVRAPLQPP